MKITIDLQGDKQLMAKLKRLENPGRVMQRGMQHWIDDAQKKIKAYPPETQANRSPGINGYSWYKRTVGTQTITGKTYKTSQDMRARWGDSFKVRRLTNGVRATLKNDATYSGFVIGEKQVWYHRNRGWINVPKYIEASKDNLVRELSKEVNKELER